MPLGKGTLSMWMASDISLSTCGGRLVVMKPRDVVVIRWIETHFGKRGATARDGGHTVRGFLYLANRQEGSTALRRKDDEDLDI
jgi:hypothetical protein